MDDGLQGRTALVTGGARRVGAAIVRRLHAAGANVVLHYRGAEAEAFGRPRGRRHEPYNEDRRRHDSSECPEGNRQPSSI